MLPKSDSAEDAATREVVSRRVLPASPERVFGAFADPAQLARWWGPRGFTNDFAEFDLRPGGRWRFTMRAPDGAEFTNACVFREVAPPARIVFDHLEPVHAFAMTMTFVARGPATELTWRMVFASADEFARVGGFIRAANEENFDRLAALLAAQP